MTALSRQWHIKIRTMLTKRPETMLTMTVQLWGQLADELIPIIGNGGFNSLYARSCYLTRAYFPWLIDDQATPDANLSFIRLSTCLAQQNVTEASEASARLIITFLDMLAILIGEPMTTTIISSVWNDTASGKCTGNFGMTRKATIQRLHTGVPGSGVRVGEAGFLDAGRTTTNLMDCCDAKS